LVGARLYARLAEQALLYSTKRDCRPPVSGSLATARRSSSGARSQTPRVGSQATGSTPGRPPSRMEAGRGPTADVGHNPRDRAHPGEDGEQRLPPYDPAMRRADSVCACVDRPALHDRWAHAP
jgi:hypothetical protein